VGLQTTQLFAKQKVETYTSSSAGSPTELRRRGGGGGGGASMDVDRAPPRAFSKFGTS
jgi:hypothetical protein